LLQLAKLKERMKVVLSQVQQVEKKIEGVKANKSKASLLPADSATEVTVCMQLMK